MTTKSDPPARWSGWWRAGKGGRWTNLLSADTEDEAWSELLSRVRGGDVLVMAEGRDPNATTGGRSFYRWQRGRRFTAENRD